MAPSAVTEDYYMILEVDQTAAPELIVKSYRRLALRLHPDRNSRQDATETFQRVCLFPARTDRFFDNRTYADS
jgi:curved DNA-binding protein CbpA